MLLLGRATLLRCPPAVVLLRVDAMLTPRHGGLRRENVGKNAKGRSLISLSK